MLLIGEVPLVGSLQDINLEPYDSTTKVKLSDAAYIGKAVLVSFIDITNGWGWLDSMKSIRTSACFPSSGEMIAVIFKYGGTVQKLDVINKLGAATYPFKILVDGAWGAGSVAYTYMNGFKNANDPCFSGTDDSCAGNTLWCYLVQPDHRIADKWNFNCWSDATPSNNDPISFRNLPVHAAFLTLSGSPGTGALQIALSGIASNPGGSPLSSDSMIVYQGPANSYTPSFSGPRVLSVIPAEGSSPSPLSALLVGFTDAVTGAAVAGNYTISGPGKGTLAVASVEYVDSVAFDTVNHTRAFFDSKNFPNAVFFIRQRFIQLCCDPAVLYAIPEKDRTLCSLMQIKIVFSKPMDQSTIDGVPGNFSTSVPGLNVSLAAYKDRDLIENLATLTLSGALVTGSFTVTAGAAVKALGSVALAGTSSVPYTADVTPPATPTVTGPACTNIKRPTWTWNADPDVAGYLVNLDGTGWVTWASTSYTPTADLPDGPHTLAVQAEDGCGNWSTSGSATITVNTQAPPAPTMHCPATTNVKRPTWTWDTVPGAVKYRTSTNEQTWTETTGTSYTPSNDLADGSYTLYVEAEDACGNWSVSATCTTIVHTQGPSAPTMHCPSCTNVKRPTWTWDAVTGATKYHTSTDGSHWTDTTGTSYTPSSDLPDGTYTLYVQTGDASGNWSQSASCTITVDTVAAPCTGRCIAPRRALRRDRHGRGTPWSARPSIVQASRMAPLGPRQQIRASRRRTISASGQTPSTCRRATPAGIGLPAPAVPSKFLPPAGRASTQFRAFRRSARLPSIPARRSSVPAVSTSSARQRSARAASTRSARRISASTACICSAHPRSAANAFPISVLLPCVPSASRPSVLFRWAAAPPLICPAPLGGGCPPAICPAPLGGGCPPAVCPAPLGGGCGGSIGCPALGPVPIDHFSQVMQLVFDPARTGSLKERMALQEVQVIAKVMPKGMWKALSMMIARIAKGRFRG